MSGPAGVGPDDAAPRYALYFAPARGTPWDRFGSTWLGRDAASGEALAQPAVAGLARSRLAQLTAAPRRYGFHATLRSPMRLRPGLGGEALQDCAAALAARHAPIDLGGLRAVRLGRFAALVPRSPPQALATLARDCVLACEALRAPLAADEAARRSAGQDARGTELVALHGYPYVLERFRFHLSLSDHADEAALACLLATAAPAVNALERVAPLRLDRLCVFIEPVPGAVLHRVADFPLAGPP